MDFNGNLVKRFPRQNGTQPIQPNAKIADTNPGKITIFEMTKNKRRRIIGIFKIEIDLSLI